MDFSPVISAEAGIQEMGVTKWMPAFAGMTENRCRSRSVWPVVIGHRSRGWFINSAGHNPSLNGTGTPSTREDPVWQRLDKGGRTLLEKPDASWGRIHEIGEI